MLNILIIEDNVIQCKQLINNISNLISNIKVSNISFTGKEALRILSTSNIDIILLDMILPDMSGLQILEFIEENNLNKYLNSTIIISSNIHLYSHLINNPYICTSISKPINWNILKDILSHLIEEKNEAYNNNNLKCKINKELNYLNYNLAHVGTHYLCDCIYEIYIYHNKNTFNLSKNIYPIIAKKNNTNVTNIKCNIFQASVNSYYECDENRMQNYFGKKFYSKPKTKDIIYTVLEHITI